MKNHWKAILSMKISSSLFQLPEITSGSTWITVSEIVWVQIGWEIRIISKRRRKRWDIPGRFVHVRGLYICELSDVNVGRVIAGVVFPLDHLVQEPAELHCVGCAGVEAPGVPAVDEHLLGADGSRELLVPADDDLLVLLVDEVDLRSHYQHWHLQVAKLSWVSIGEGGATVNLLDMILGMFPSRAPGRRTTTWRCPCHSPCSRSPSASSSGSRAIFYLSSHAPGLSRWPAGRTLHGCLCDSANLRCQRTAGDWKDRWYKLKSKETRTNLYEKSFL